MPIIDSILQEFDQEAATTRRVLERVPEGQLTWKPHARSMSLGQLALHIATSPGNIANMAQQDYFEFGEFKQDEAASAEQLLEAFDASLASVHEALSSKGDDWLMTAWSAGRDGATIMTMPRLALLRAILLNHWYHHRGQMTVYLRLLDIPVPSVYGPTADENPFA